MDKRVQERRSPLLISYRVKKLKVRPVKIILITMSLQKKSNLRYRVRQTTQNLSFITSLIQIRIQRSNKTFLT